MITINIASEFSDTPGARYKKEDPFSGEEFREQFLEKHFEDEGDNEKIKIVLDGVEGYATSFLEETFGGLGRKYGVERVRKRFEFVSDEDPLLISEINKYIDDCEGYKK